MRVASADSCENTPSPQGAALDARHAVQPVEDMQQVSRARRQAAGTDVRFDFGCLFMA